jgi:hypothetical protein
MFPPIDLSAKVPALRIIVTQFGQPPAHARRRQRAIRWAMICYVSETRCPAVRLSVRQRGGGWLRMSYRDVEPGAKAFIHEAHFRQPRPPFCVTCTSGNIKSRLFVACA